jgi:hypothetical protein
MKERVAGGDSFPVSLEQMALLPALDERANWVGTGPNWTGLD